jgi:hypothetical protein
MTPTAMPGLPPPPPPPLGGQQQNSVLSPQPFAHFLPFPAAYGFKPPPAAWHVLSLIAGLLCAQERCWREICRRNTRRSYL